MKFAFIVVEKASAVPCQVLDVSTSGSYARKKRAPSARTLPGRPHGETGQFCEESRDEIAAYVERDVRLTKVRKLLARKGVEILAPRCIATRSKFSPRLSVASA